MVLRNSNKYFTSLIFLILNLISISLTAINAQDIPASSSGKLLFYLDQSSFAGNGESSVTEFYLMFYADQILNSVKAIDNRTELKIESEITTLYDKTVASRNWITEINFKLDQYAVNNQVVYDQWREELKPGEYKIKVEVFDKSKNLVGKAVKIFYVPDFNTNKKTLSDLQLISSVNKDNSDGHFNKGNLKILPNPSRRFGILIPDLYFYFELYGLDSTNGNLSASYQIEDKNLNILKRIDDAQIESQSNSTAVIHGINVSTLNTGVYTLKGSVKEEHSVDVIRFSKVFEIIQADFFENSILLSREQASIFETLLSYIGSIDQLGFYKSLSIPGKAQFIIQFWKNLDNDPNTSENEYLIEIQKRFNHSKNHFGALGLNGWETDRGRICIKYGIPNQINQFNTEANTAPYEIWIYNEQRTYEFVFSDLRSNGRYILLHSNREGEIFNSNWPEQIKKM